MKAARSLKARALQLLAQRDQSPVELRRKLLAHARETACLADSVNIRDEVVAARTSGVGPGLSDAPAGGSMVAEGPPIDLQVEVDAVLKWLEEKRFLSVERFVESRVSARSSRFGVLRIRHEMARHGVALSPEADEALVGSELDRAAAVRARRFSGPPTDAKESARQARFLAARGFSADVIRRVLRDAARESDPTT